MVSRRRRVAATVAGVIGMVSGATTVIPVGLVVGGLASAGVGGIAFWRTRARAADR
ncbi:hypothetical protein [Kribbella sp. NPDC023855]|uniref:hypothetical protein n=1 Tax=Kribbella sp. NPDC023855 TaxID=3154698 RepID=UPI0033F56E14